VTTYDTSQDSLEFSESIHEDPIHKRNSLEEPSQEEEEPKKKEKRKKLDASEKAKKKVLKIIILSLIFRKQKK
jgi:hypothetical protein